MNVISNLGDLIWYLFPNDENDENSKTGKDEQHTKVIVGKIWQALLNSFDTSSLITKAVYTLKNHFLSDNANTFLLKNRLSQDKTKFPYPAIFPLRFSHPIPIKKGNPAPAGY